MPYLNKKELRRWRIDNGDNSHILNHSLNCNSVVMDIGGYTGKWAERIIEKYDPYFYILEPIPQFYNILVDKFSSNSKVSIINSGLSDKDRLDFMYIDNDGSSVFQDNNSTKIEVSFLSVDTLLNKIGKDSIDLVQINIEGSEYSLIEDMIQKNLIIKFKTIQIQFHLGIENCENRRFQIQENLQRLGYTNVYNYPFVWEVWKLSQ
jgi:FkbM family methyltransferase